MFERILITVTMFLRRRSIAVLVLISTIFAVGHTCSRGIGGANDYEYIEDPVFTMDISPPIAWTYFPLKSSDNAVIYFFIGQSNDTVKANQRADAELKAATLDALSTANIPMYGVEITNDYMPFQVENPGTLARGVGPLYGKEEAGALSQTAIGGANDFVWMPFHRILKLTLHNVGATRYTWNIVKNTFMQKMALNFNARFVGDITVNKI